MAGVFDLVLLGGLDLRDPEGRECRTLLQRPKLVALLAYLAAARPYGFHRRDGVVAVFWPDLDQQHARNALRQAAHQLRSALGPDVLQNRGGEELALNPGRVRCDVAVFAEHLAAGRAVEALDLVRGVLLPGFHLSDTPDFERWLDEEREHLSREVAAAASALATREREAGSAVGAVHWARRAAQAAPYDEGGLRLLLGCLDEAGDRAGALRAYERFASMVEDELGVEPAPETVALVEGIRARMIPVESGLDVRRAVGPPLGPDPSSDRSPVVSRAGPIAAEPPNPVAVGPGPSPVRHPRLWGGRAIALVAGLGVLGTWVASRSGGDQATANQDRPSIAVLPLSGGAGTIGEAYLSDGITEELIGELGRIRGLRVVSRTSVTRFKDTQLSIPLIADSLGVSYLVEGWIVRQEERLRLRIQLIRARPETHVWTEAYDRDIRDALPLQREIARAVATALGVEDTTAPVTEPAPAASTGPEAFDAYLRGLYRSSRLEFEEARREFEHAVHEDPMFAPAYAGLARAYMGQRAFGSLPHEEAHGGAKSAAERAVTLDPSSVEGHLALADVHGMSWEWPEVEQELRLALGINPSHVGVHTRYAEYLCSMSRYDEAVDHAMEARRLDPLSPKANGSLGETLWWAGRLEEAIEQLELMVELGMPDYQALAFAYLGAGRNEEGVAAMRTAEDQFFPDPDRSMELAEAHAMAGDAAEALRILGNLARAGTPLDPMELAIVWAHLGDRDRAIRYLEDAYLQRDPWLIGIGDPLLAPLREDPRYEAIIERMGLPRPGTGGNRASALSLEWPRWRRSLREPGGLRPFRP